MTPPCDKDIDYLVLRYPVSIPQDQFQNLRQNVFMYRNDFVIRQNINPNYGDLSRQDVQAGLIYRYNDYNRYTGDDCRESDELRIFINNAIKLNANTQTEGFQTVDL